MISRILLSLLMIVSALSTNGADLRTRNVFLITTDGLRWEELFNGAEQILLSKEFGNISSTNLAKEVFWRESAEERRQLLLPFFWSEIAKHGQLWGNRQKKSDVRVTNGRNFSYPGYNEFLTGIADPKIDSNDKKLNANTNVFEWLHGQPGFKDRVAAAVSWDVLPWILNGPRAGFPIWSAFDAPEGTKRLEVPELLNEVAERGKTVWRDVILDTFVGAAAKHCVRTMRPRALYVQYGETDDWAHEGAYERYLKAARQFDRFIGELWALVQSMPEYRDTTTFIITSDHGRGPAPIAWKNHGANIPESAYMWLAVIGPDTPALGERSNVPLITQSQTAATLAAFLGKDFNAASSQSAKPIAQILPAK
jgi:hypothetical protein